MRDIDIVSNDLSKPPGQFELGGKVAPIAGGRRDRNRRLLSWPLLRTGIAVILAVAIGLAGLIAVKIKQTQTLDSFTRQSQDYADWASYQLDAERARLEITLLNAKSGNLLALAEIHQRYEIFASRLSILEQGEYSSSIRSLAAYNKAKSAIQDLMKKFDSALVSNLDTAGIDAMEKAVAALAEPIRILVLDTVHARYEFDLEYRKRIQIFEQVAMFILILLILLIAGFAAYALIALRRAFISERGLRESEQRLRDFAQIASDWYWEIDASYRIVYVSETAPMNGRAYRRPKIFLGAALLDFLRAIPDNEAHVHELADQFAQRQTFRDLSFQFVDSNNRRYHSSISGKPHYSERGEFLGYRGTARDITDDIEAEMELSTALQEAQVANDAKLAFLANMSHELRTPLNAIIGFSEMLQMFARSNLDVTQLGYLRDIHSSGQHLLGIINSILELAKMDGGRIDLAIERVPLADILTESLRMLDNMIKRSGVKIEVGKNIALLPPVSGDRMRLRQIFLNLISNAIKYTPKESRVFIDGKVEDDDMVEITIVDEGIGMRPEDILVALRPFERINNPYTRSRDGIGLGLPIADSLIREHGGRMSIFSQAGEGTAISLHFPRAPRAGDSGIASQSAALI